MVNAATLIFVGTTVVPYYYRSSNVLKESINPSTRNKNAVLYFQGDKEILIGLQLNFCFEYLNAIFT